jgi:hypothetical protein
MALLYTAHINISIGCKTNPNSETVMKLDGCSDEQVSPNGTMSE